MRYLFGFLCVCALGVVPLVGCSETAGDGGSGDDYTPEEIEAICRAWCGTEAPNGPDCNDPGA
jgi:hypothetical protein